MNQYHLLNRPNREITTEEVQSILKFGKYAVIAMCRDNEPYIVSLSYGYDAKAGALYFHTAKSGLKLDFIRTNPQVCATIIEDGGYIIDECGHIYRTAVFWGEMTIVTELEEKRHAMSILINHLESKKSVIDDHLFKSEEGFSRMEVLKLTIKEIHGKAGR
jgi:nitroimidazol reductase NimA-like FMN-containing flavoprotein (pyridoxamine 5'-phosphate oxidase superfamily)